MKQLQKAVLCSLGGFVAAASLGLFVPGAAHAVVAALVQVANTTSNPVPAQEVSRMGAQLVELGCHAAPGVNPPCNVLTAQATNAGPFTVPAGQTFVITEVDGTMLDSTNAGGISALVLNQGVSSREIWYFPNGGPTTQLRFTSGIPVAGGQQLSIDSLANPQISPVVEIHGYLTN